MSKKKQLRAREQRDAAQDREQNARDRAERSRERGEGMVARVHEQSANAQAAAAGAAERFRQADALIEGDQLADEQPDTRQRDDEQATG